MVIALKGAKQMAFRKIALSTRRGRTEDNDELYVTMRNNGILHINTVTYNAMGQPDFVTLLYDDENDDFAIQPVDEKQSGEYVLTVRKVNENAAGYDLSSQSFMKEIGYIDNRLHRFIGEWNEDESMLIVRRETDVVKYSNTNGARRGRKRKIMNEAEELVTVDV
jgi:hypothetical protein